MMNIEVTAAQPRQDAATQGVELSVIVPTFNERENIVELVRGLEVALSGVAWEVIFVDDDSPDGTANLVREIGERNRRVRGIRRIGRRGLSSACIEGMLSSSAKYLAVMDADLQHDESRLPKMLRVLREEQADIVVGSRYMPGGGIGQWASTRASISRFATRLCKLVFRVELTDPMSGFFMLRRELFQDTAHLLSGMGFKILMDLIASAPRPVQFRELPYEFRGRHAGESKLDNRVAWDFLMLILDKRIGHIIPVRFIAFSLIGGFGVVVHMAALTFAFRGVGIDFVTSQIAATLVAMTSNFFLNNLLTYKDVQLRGWKILRGWVSFSTACSVGMVANVSVAAYLYNLETLWVISALVGVLLSSVWNYAVTAIYTWRTPRSA